MRPRGLAVIVGLGIVVGLMGLSGGVETAFAQASDCEGASAWPYDPECDVYWQTRQAQGCRENLECVWQWCVEQLGETPEVDICVSTYGTLPPNGSVSLPPTPDT